MAGEPRPLRSFGTFTVPPVPSAGRVPYGPPEAPSPAPLAFLAPWLEGAVDVVRGGLFGSTGASDTAAAKAAELLGAGLPLLPLKALGFFSRVDKAVDLIPKKGAHPNKVASLLKSNASAEELAYRNVPEFLAGKGNATVTPAELTAHLAAHPPPVPKVVSRGTSTDPAHVYAARDLLEHGATPEAVMTALQQAYKAATPGELSNALFAARNPSYPAGPTKFGNYTVPGGEAYRETLVTLPPQPKPNQAALEAEIQAGQARLQELYQQAEGLSRRGPDALKPVWAEIEDLQTHHRNLMREMSADPPNQFRSSHFEEPNIVVHTRANERTLPTGERGRFVEEIQSDWHQLGKERGYAPATPPPGLPQVAAADVRLEEGAHSWMAFTPDGRKVEIGKGTVSDAAEAQAYAERYFNRREAERAAALRDQEVRQVPDAPFKETWPDLGLKQQVLETAADPNAEWIGFTSGATQAGRYDLSKQISKVSFEPASSSDYSLGTLYAYDPEGKQVIRETRIDPSQLDEYIGKEPAEKLRQQIAGKAHDREQWDVTRWPHSETGKWYVRDPNGEIVEDLGGFRTEERAQTAIDDYRTEDDRDATISGLDLQVGGEGMRHFYDQVLPKRLEKIVKPFGGTVERGTLETPLYDLETQAKNLGGEVAMWYARLTPEMKERIRREGLPLLSLLPLGVLGHYGQTPQESTR